MKKIICVLLALILVAGVPAGCSKREENKEDTPKPVVSQTSPVEKQIGPYKLGIVQYMEYAPLDEAREAFMSRLDEWGLDDGELEVDYQNAGGSPEKAAEICKKFADNKVDVIVAISSPAAKAAVTAAAGNTKVVFLGVSDAKTDLGLENASQPEGNVTGVADLTAAQATVDLALQVNPRLSTAGLLYDPSCPFGTAYVQAIKQYCAQREITVLEGQVTNAGEVPQRMTELCGQADAIFTPVDSTVASAAQEAAKAAKDAGRPWYAATQDVVRQGAMACISIDYTEAGNKAADMAVQLAAGRKASELPVYSFGSGQVSVNQETMTALAAEVPEEILGTAIYCQPQATA